MQKRNINKYMDTKVALLLTKISSRQPLGAQIRKKFLVKYYFPENGIQTIVPT